MRIEKFDVRPHTELQGWAVWNFTGGEVEICPHDAEQKNFPLPDKREVHIPGDRSFAVKFGDRMLDFCIEGPFITVTENGCFVACGRIE